ncbi:tetratricopeptide repeat protein [Alkalihalobacillus sp. AL-G]|uniref:tetratricopeptide repeat protein n=1 Tax=Alkalihalobacillus sp. AL-G TaxID=2926399 RepID=UPI002729DFE4|nr:tetratricopeptide repeat protein [Alkalihalobacillus sp. AL-G]WLD94282.1 tetratricopeptide repeat protein [Alkalihalobacillus sp. AL-G]
MESSVGKRIKVLRKDLGLTQGDLAGDQLSRAMLSLIERDLTTPSLRTIEYLSSKLGVSVGDLLGEKKHISGKTVTYEEIKNGLNICTTLFKVEKYVEAKTRLKDLIKIRTVPFPEKWLAHRLLGQIYEKLNQDEKALYHFNEALSYLPSTETKEIIEVYYYITLANRKLKDYKRGIESALNASALINSRYVDIECLLQFKILYNLALCYCRVKEFQKGLDVIHKAIEIMEANQVSYSNGHFYMLKGLAELYMKKYAEGILSSMVALDYLKLEEEPRKYIGSQINMGILKRKHGSVEESFYYLNDSLEKANKYHFRDLATNSYYELALTSLYTDDLDQAEQYANNGLRLAASNSHVFAQCHYVLGKVNIKRGSHEEALTNLKKADHVFQLLNEDPWTSLVKTELAICYEKLNDLTMALQNLFSANQRLLEKEIALISTELPVTE